MAYTRENIQFSESVVKYNLINFLDFLIYMGSLSGAGRRFCGRSAAEQRRPSEANAENKTAHAGRVGRCGDGERLTNVTGFWLRMKE